MLTDPDTLRVAVLCSRQAPGLADLLVHERDGGYLVAGIVTSEESFQGRTIAEEFGVPWVSRPLRAFHRAAGAPLADRATRAAFDAGTAIVLERFRPDVVFLSGWLYTVTHPLLEEYGGRLFNVHHSDLTAPDPRRRYPGLRAVRDAIAAGESETRATLHEVSRELDAGTPILRSWSFPVDAATSVRDLVRDHERRVLAEAFGPLLVTAATLFAEGRLSRSPCGWWVDGVAGPFDLARDGSLRPTAGHVAELQGGNAA